MPRKSHSKKKNLTPYQGKHRTFGEFYCPRCGGKWQSGYSWANCGQQCRRCKVNVFPWRQRPLLKVQVNHIDLKKKHRMDLCQKCKELGFSCSQLDD